VRSGGEAPRNTPPSGCARGAHATAAVTLELNTRALRANNNNSEAPR
jgi:hypothetical protein